MCTWESEFLVSNLPKEGHLNILNETKSNTSIWKGFKSLQLVTKGEIDSTTVWRGKKEERREENTKVGNSDVKWRRRSDEGLAERGAWVWIDAAWQEDGWCVEQDDRRERWKRCWVCTEREKEWDSKRERGWRVQVSMYKSLIWRRAVHTGI